MFSNKTMTTMMVMVKKKKCFAQTQFSKLLSWLYKHSDYVALKVSFGLKRNKVEEECNRKKRRQK